MKTRVLYLLCRHHADRAPSLEDVVPGNSRNYTLCEETRRIDKLVRQEEREKSPPLWLAMLLAATTILIPIIVLKLVFALGDSL